MKINFLFSYPILNFALNKNIRTDEGVSSKEAFEIAGNIADIWATSQAIDKISTSDMLTYDQIIKFKGFIHEEKTTKGVASFDPHTSTDESAKALAKIGVVIVITTDSNKITKSKRIFALTPSEFIFAYKQATRMLEKLPFKKSELLDLLILSVSDPKLFGHICQNKKEDNSKG